MSAFVGLFMHMEDHQVWGPVVNGVGQVVRENGARLVVFAAATSSQAAQLDEVRARELFCFRENEFDGVILAFASDGMLKYAEKLSARGYPTLLVARRAGTVPRVVCDNSNAVRATVRLLYQRGHRRIAFLAGEDGNYSADERLKGYREGLAECGLPLDPELVLPGFFTESAGRTGTEAALKRGLVFSALIAANDPSAFGALAALRDSGVRVPEEVEVIGFDNMARGRWTEPPLSTIDMQFYPMAHLAAEELFRLLREKNCRQELVIPTNFILRKSSRERPEHSGARPLLDDDWMEHRRYYEIGLGRLRRDPELAQLMDRVLDPEEPAPALEEAFKRLLEGAARHEVEVSTLFRLLEDVRQSAAKRRDPAEKADGPDHFEVHFNRVVALVAAAGSDEQRKRAEISIRFRIASSRLRELSFEAPSEAAVIVRLQQTLRDLDIGRAALYLTAPDADPEQGTWHGWKRRRDGSFETEENKIRRSQIELTGFVKEAPPGIWLVLPLSYKETHYGFLLLQAESQFLLHYGELVRHLSAALHVTRMYSALAKAHEALRASQRELIEASRLAGIAEIATGILHNIGNAMNSVTTSASLAADRLRRSRIDGVERVVALMEQHGNDLPGFFANDARGPQALRYLRTLADHLTRSREETLKELKAVQSGIEHINHIVAAQQAYVGAAVTGLVDVIGPAELMDQAVQLNEASLARHHVTLVREFSPAPPIRVQRQKALQILVNLIRNAKDALEDRDPADRRVTLRIRYVRDHRVELEVSDNGTGIDPEGLTRIFAFGYSTKRNGHGFGLHSSALAAKEMGGTLRAESDGRGKGASFILGLPAAENLSDAALDHEGRLFG